MRAIEPAWHEFAAKHESMHTALVGIEEI